MKNDERQIDLLVLDAHGVVFTSSFRQFLASLADERRQSRDEVLAQWRDEVRLAAWTGAISESEIWRRFGVNTHDERGKARELMEGTFDIGCAGERLPDWARRVPVWMLSNHRSEWLLPRIRKFNLETYLSNVIVSDKVGAAKPDSAAFQPIVDQDVAPSRVLFVDDQPRNLDAASRLGFQVIQATVDGTWTKLVDNMLVGNHQPSEQTCQTPSSTTCSSS